MVSGECEAESVGCVSVSERVRVRVREIFFSGGWVGDGQVDAEHDVII